MLTKITLNEFASRFRDDILGAGTPVTWFLGAGCSVTSGIPAAGGLVRKWLEELHVHQGRTAPPFPEWVAGYLPDYDASNSGKYYAEVFHRRHPSPAGRQREIETICARGEPGYGYATFAQILSHPAHGVMCNTILTTNFDDLVADALYLFGARTARPQVVTHDALAGYVRFNSPRPTIIKLHGDAHFGPRNLAEETSRISDDVAIRLRPFLQSHAMIFVGYGGNDRSITEFLKESGTPELSPPIFWIGDCDPPEDLLRWLQGRNALRVDHLDFDRAMHLLRGVLEIAHPSKDRWDNLFAGYLQAYSNLEKEIADQPPSDTKLALQEASLSTATSLPDYWREIRRLQKSARDNPSLAKSEHLNAAQKYSESAAIQNYCGIFLSDTDAELSDVENAFQRAVEIEPGNASYIGDYALFISKHGLAARYDEAETLFKEAIRVDPFHANNNINYAAFLFKLNRIDESGVYFKKAMQLDSTQANILSGYASYLSVASKEFGEAEDLFRLSLMRDPNDPNTLANFASLISKIGGRNSEAMDYYLRAIDSGPMLVHIRIQFAAFLANTIKDISGAIRQYRECLSIDSNHAIAHGNIAQLLLASGKRRSGLQHLKEAERLAPNIGRLDLQVEAKLYGYAHVPSKSEQYLLDLRELLAQGARSEGWDFGPTVARAEKDGHPNIELLKDLVRVIADGGDPDDLSRHPDWSTPG